MEILDRFSICINAPGFIIIDAVFVLISYIYSQVFVVLSTN